ncbi:MAG: prepilin-type N-terminal cleavage/methylation domain-containing protein [Pseudomonadales bacterium]|nr:prepilin-type N-terminal cleavage/methylation domain-containing protein [Pseudomonadales bacterium]
MNCSFSAEDSNFNGSAVKASHAKAEDFKVLNVKGYGFTLIELLIVVVIIGILSAVALPTYDSYVKRGYRAQAKKDLMTVAAAISLFKAKNINQNYDSVDTSATAVYGGVTDAITNASSSDYYTLGVDVATNGATYLITAIPVSGNYMEGDGSLVMSDKSFGCWYEGSDSTTTLATACATDNAF